MGYHDGTQNFTIRKYDILAFKWRVLSIFSIPGSKVIPKNKRTLVKCPGLYILLLGTVYTGSTLIEISEHMNFMKFLMHFFFVDIVLLVWFAVPLYLLT